MTSQYISNICSAALKMAEIMVIFDFDSTIIECDSDNWVLDDTALTEKFYQLLPTIPWNPLMVTFFFFFFQVV